MARTNDVTQRRINVTAAKYYDLVSPPKRESKSDLFANTSAFLRAGASSTTAARAECRASGESAETCARPIGGRKVSIRKGDSVLARGFPGEEEIPRVGDRKSTRERVDDLMRHSRSVMSAPIALLPKKAASTKAEEKAAKAASKPAKPVKPKAEKKAKAEKPPKPVAEKKPPKAKKAAAEKKPEAPLPPLPAEFEKQAAAVHDVLKIAQPPVVGHLNNALRQMHHGKKGLAKGAVGLAMKHAKDSGQGDAFAMLEQMQKDCGCGEHATEPKPARVAKEKKTVEKPKAETPSEPTAKPVKEKRKKEPALSAEQKKADLMKLFKESAGL